MIKNNKIGPPINSINYNDHVKIPKNIPMLQEVVKVVIVELVAKRIQLKCYQLRQAQANNKKTNPVRKLEGILYEVQNVCITFINTITTKQTNQQKLNSSNSILFFG